MTKLSLLGIRKSPRSNYYCFKFEEGVQQTIKLALLELTKAYPSKHEIGRGIIEHWFVELDKYGEPTEKFIPLQSLFDQHYSFENDFLSVDVIFSQNKVHIIIGAAKDIQEEISNIFKRYS